MAADAAVRVAQIRIMNALPGGNLRYKGQVKKMYVDGRWGSFTQAAFDTLSATDRRQIEEEMWRLYQTSPQAEALKYRGAKQREYQEAGSPKQTDGWLSSTQVLAAIEREMESRGTPQVWRPTIASRQLLDLEAGKSQKGYNLFSLNPDTQAAGLFQFVVKTWNGLAARKHLNLIRIDKRSLVTWAQSRQQIAGSPFDFYASIRAYVALATDNARALASARPPVPVTVETLYAMHQQGSVSRLRSARWLNVSQQSSPSLQVLARAHELALT